MKKTHIILLSLTLFLLTHFVFLFFSPFAYYHEDENVASLGLEIIEGRFKLPFWFHLDSPHSGGSIFSGLITVPFYFLFGKNYLSLKLAGLFLSSVTFLLLLNFLIDLYGKWIAIPFGLLFVIPPPNKFMHDLMRGGNTSELALVLTTTLLFSYFFLKSKRKSSSKAFFLGFLCGFGIWIQYASVLLILTIFLFWFSFDKKFFLKRIFLVFLTGVFVGLLPFIIYNLQYNFASFSADPILVGQDFSSENIIFTLLERFYQFFFSFLPKSFLLQDVAFVSSKHAGLIFYFFILSSILYLTAVNKKRIIRLAKAIFDLKRSLDVNFFNFDLLLLSFLLISIIAVNILLLPVGAETGWGEITVWSYYYLAFLQPFLFLAFSIGLTRLMKSFRQGKIIFYVALLILTIFLVVSFVKLIFFDKEDVGCATFGGWIPDEVCKPLVDTTEILPTLYFNEFLLRPHARPETSAYETGFSFCRNFEVFKKGLLEIDSYFRKHYAAGCGAYWHLLFSLPDEEIKKEWKETFQSELELLSSEEKIALFYYLLKGAKPGVYMREELFFKIEKVVPSEAQIYLKKAFFKIEEAIEEK